MYFWAGLKKPSRISGPRGGGSNPPPSGTLAWPHQLVILVIHWSDEVFEDQGAPCLVVCDSLTLQTGSFGSGFPYQVCVRVLWCEVVNDADGGEWERRGVMHHVLQCHTSNR